MSIEKQRNTLLKTLGQPLASFALRWEKIGELAEFWSDGQTSISLKYPGYFSPAHDDISDGRCKAKIPAHHVPFVANAVKLQLFLPYRKVIYCAFCRIGLDPSIGDHKNQTDVKF